MDLPRDGRLGLIDEALDESFPRETLTRLVDAGQVWVASPPENLPVGAVIVSELDGSHAAYSGAASAWIGTCRWLSSVPTTTAAATGAATGAASTATARRVTAGTLPARGGLHPGRHRFVRTRCAVRVP